MDSRIPPNTEPMRSIAIIIVMEDLELYTRAQLMSLICKATVILAKRATR